MVIFILQKRLEFNIAKWKCHCLLATRFVVVVIGFAWVSHFRLPSQDDLLYMQTTSNIQSTLNFMSNFKLYREVPLPHTFFFQTAFKGHHE